MFSYAALARSKQPASKRPTKQARRRNGKIIRRKKKTNDNNLWKEPSDLQPSINQAIHPDTGREKTEKKKGAQKGPIDF